MKQIITYKEPRWVALRKSILERDRYLDQYWKRYGKFKTADIVHHIFPVEDFPEYQYEKWNLISLARSTHNMMHDRDTDELTDIGIELLLRTARKYKIDVPSYYIRKKQKGKKYEYRY